MWSLREESDRDSEFISGICAICAICAIWVGFWTIRDAGASTGTSAILHLRAGRGRVRGLTAVPLGLTSSHRARYASTRATSV